MMFDIPRRFAIVAALGLAMTTAVAAAPSGPVIATIKPIHSLVAAVMEGIGEPTLLIPGGVSPHSFTLKPSEAVALNQAALVFWAGQGMEGFLANGPGTFGRDAVWVELSAADGVALLAPRQAAVWPEQPIFTAQPHSHFGFDPHFWLDPLNAVATLSTIASALSAVDPDNADRYAANAAAYGQRLSAMTDELIDALAPIRDLPFIVLHDGYQYFEHRFGVTAAGAVLPNNEVPSGARRIVELRLAINERHARCVFAEPQYSPDILAVLVEGSDVRVGNLDSLGADIPAGPDQYPTLMRNLAISLLGCLSASV